MRPDEPVSDREPAPPGRREFLGRTTALAMGAASARVLSAPPAGAAVDTTAKRDLVILQAIDLTALDPHRSMYASNTRVAGNVFDTLLRNHPDGSLLCPLSSG
jgi:ABC-type transport system substrate-binding protein